MQVEPLGTATAHRTPRRPSKVMSAMRSMSINHSLAKARLSGRRQRFKDVALLLLVGFIFQCASVVAGWRPFVSGDRPTGELVLTVIVATYVGQLLIHATILPSTASPRIVVCSLVNIMVFATAPQLIWSGVRVYSYHSQDGETGYEYRSSFGAWERHAPRVNGAAASYGVVQAWFVVIISLVSLLALVRGSIHLPPRAQISLGYMVMSRSLLVVGAIALVDAAVLWACARQAVGARKLVPHIFTGVLSLVFGSVSAHKPTRRRTIAFLMSRGDAKVQVAAGITAALSNSNEASTSLKNDAKVAFRYVTLGDGGVTFDDLFSNRPDAEVFAKSHHATMGDVDVFMSHSWSDDPHAKWAALQRWRADFKRRGSGREPRLWIDKCCLNQKNIDAALKSLPIFLSGTHKLLILLGPTWLDRLWCVLELFTFVVMGGTPDRIELIVVNATEIDVETGGGSDAAPVAQMPQQLQTFDVRQAQCTGDNNVAKIMQIIESSGTLEDFNSRVIATLGAAIEQGRRRHYASSDRSSFGDIRSPESTCAERRLLMSPSSSVRHGLRALFVTAAAGRRSASAVMPTAAPTATAAAARDGGGSGATAAAAFKLGLPRELSAAEAASYREAFELIDADGSGAIDPEEMLQAVHSIGIANATAEDVASLFALVDTDGNGELDADEFVGAMSRIGPLEQPRRYEEEAKREDHENSKEGGVP